MRWLDGITISMDVSLGAEQPLGRGSALSRLGAELELRRSGSSLGPSQYRAAALALFSRLSGQWSSS